LVHATAKGKRLVEAGRKRRVERIASQLGSLSAAQLGLVDEAIRILEPR
jgi:hypothetical protein